jgi:hypothetical protein
MSGIKNDPLDLGDKLNRRECQGALAGLHVAVAFYAFP